LAAKRKAIQRGSSVRSDPLLEKPPAGERGASLNVQVAEDDHACLMGASTWTR
jgi:hypothetical protein